MKYDKPHLVMSVHVNFYLFQWVWFTFMQAQLFRPKKIEDTNFTIWDC